MKTGDHWLCLPPNLPAMWETAPETSRRAPLAVNSRRPPAKSTERQRLAGERERENLSKQRLPEPSAPSPPRSAAVEHWVPRCHVRAQGTHACGFTHNTHSPTHTHACTHKAIHTHAHTHAPTHTCTHARTHMHSHARATPTYTVTCTSVYMPMLMCAHTRTYTKYTLT